MNECRLIFFAVALVLIGCATFVEGSSQSIAIATPPTSGAQCELSNSRGNWRIISPGSVSIDKSKEPLQVRCTKPGWQDGIATIPAEFEGWTAGNVLTPALIGIAIDASTGAIHHYPQTYEVSMTQASAAPVSSTTEATIGQPPPGALSNQAAQ